MSRVAPDTSKRLSAGAFDSLGKAITQEIAAQREHVGTGFLDIDAIELLQKQADGYVYRLVLSDPVNLHPEQVLNFEVRKPREQISAVIVSCDDAGLIVLASKPLPDDATLIKYSLDPSFILVALRDFLDAQLLHPSGVMSSVASRSLPQPTDSADPRPCHASLNDYQADAVRRVLDDMVYLLWGPPGTGKTHALGYAVRLARERGWNILVVSTSNAAVDAGSRAILRHLPREQHGDFYRMGHSLDADVYAHTASGKLSQRHPHLARQTMETRQRIERHFDENGTTENFDLNLFRALEGKLKSFEERASQIGQELAEKSPIIACTLAKMVLDRTLGERTFDLVVIDEASMVSVPFALAAAAMAESHLTVAGDCQQLPPICQSDGPPATDWFGRNLYGWLDVESEMIAGQLPAAASFLAAQYRMTPAIGKLVSDLSYNGKLITAREGFDGDFQGAAPILIPAEEGFAATYYSVREGSYFHPCAVPLIHGLAGALASGELLLLTPFRPQRSLLAATAVDIQHNHPKLAVTASTIHRAQGSECRAVIVDLTTHHGEALVSFFRDPQCERLFNVAISRARDELFVIANTRLIDILAQHSRFWRRFQDRIGFDLDVMDVDEVCEEIPRYASVDQLPRGGGDRGATALYCHGRSAETLEPFAKIIASATASRKLFVTPTDQETQVEGGAVVRRDRRGDLPRLLVVGETLCIPRGESWYAVRSRNACRTLWRIGFAHLADDEADPRQASRFFCPECGNGNLVIKNFKGEGWFLACNNWQAQGCLYRRRLSLHDAKLKARLTNMRCPMGHPLTVRTSGTSMMFLACENYPSHEYTESLRILEGT